MLTTREWFDMPQLIWWSLQMMIPVLRIIKTRVICITSSKPFSIPKFWGMTKNSICGTWHKICRPTHFFSYRLFRHGYSSSWHDDIIIWKHFPRNCPFVRGIHQSPVDSPYKGQWRTALVFSSCAPEQTTEQIVMIWDAMLLIVTSL